MKRIFLYLGLIVLAFTFFGCIKKKVKIYVYFNDVPGAKTHLYQGVAREGDNIYNYVYKRLNIFKKAIKDYEYQNPNKVFLNFKYNSKYVRKHSLFNEPHVHISPNYINKGEVVLTYDTMGAPFDVDPQILNFANTPNDKWQLDHSDEMKWKGYQFIGWYFDKAYKKPVTSASQITVSTTVYARWVKESKTVRVRFFKGKAKPFENGEYIRYAKKGEPFIFANEYIKDPTLNNHKFAFWSSEKDPNKDSAKFDFTKPLYKDTDVYPYFDEDKHDTIKYVIPKDKMNADAKTYSYDLHVYKGEPINKAKGYYPIQFKDPKFVRWEITINGKKYNFDPNMILDDDKKSVVENTYTLEAIFQQDDEAVCKFYDTDIYDVVFKKGSNLLEYIQTIPDINGKVFLGWYSDKELTTKFDFTKTYNEDVTLYPKFVDLDKFFDIELSKGDNDKTVEINEVNSSMVPNINELTHLGIPSYYGGYKVGTFNKAIFRGYTNLKYVSTPRYINAINDEDIFKDTQFMKDFGNSENIIIGQTLFKYQLNVESFTVPNHVKSISKRAFKYNDYIKEVKLHDSIFEISEEAFMGCANLEKINLNFAKYIRDRAFQFCRKLDNLNLRYAAVLGDMVFYENTSLTNFEYTKDLNTIGEAVFFNTPYLKNYFAQGHDYFVINNRLVAISENHQIINKEITIDGQNGKDNFNIISKGAISKLSSKYLNDVEKVNIRNVDELRSGAIANLTNLKEVNIDKFLIRAQNHSFSELPSLIKIYIDRTKRETENYEATWNNNYPVEYKA